MISLGTQPSIGLLWGLWWIFYYIHICIQITLLPFFLIYNIWTQNYFIQIKSTFSYRLQYYIMICKYVISKFGTLPKILDVTAIMNCIYPTIEGWKHSIEAFKKNALFKVHFWNQILPLFYNLFLINFLFSNTFNNH